jgi:2-alkenal reductase
VADVVSGGPADQAGIRAGSDLITAIDGQPVTSFDEMLSYLVTNKSPGDSVVLTVLRDGHPVDITVTLGTRP